MWKLSIVLSTLILCMQASVFSQETTVPRNADEAFRAGNGLMEEKNNPSHRWERSHKHRTISTVWSSSCFPKLRAVWRMRLKSSGSS